jgi:hypothetical protein
VLLTGCGGGPSGSYEAKSPDGQVVAMTLDFQKGDKVKVSIPMVGQGAECDYTVDGDRVNIKPPASAGPMGDTLVLTRKGDTYECDMGGDKLVFTKKK